MVEVKQIYDAFVQRKDISQRLSEFISGAEDFNCKVSDNDVVREYLHMSGGCKEIWQLIKDLSKYDENTVVLVLKMACNILIRIASDLPMYSSVGEALANNILACGLQTVTHSMRKSRNPDQAKAAIHLLSSMVALGSHIANDVFTKLKLSETSDGHLFKQNNLSEEEDVRGAFINLIVLFISLCGSSTVCKLVNMKGFLNNILPGLTSDRASTIILVLSTFRTHIVDNPKVFRSSKYKLFSDYNLKSVAKLFRWEGPLMITSGSLKRKHGTTPTSQVLEATEEEMKAVKESAYQFMLAICCSSRNGLIFKDLSCGTDGLNRNRLLTSILMLFPQPYADALVSEFVVSVLKASPDQLNFYLPSLKDSFYPRFSTQWLETINLYKKITSAQNPVGCLFKTGDRLPTSKLVTIARTLTIPDIITDSEILEFFKTGHPHLCHFLLDYIYCIMKQVRKIFNFCHYGNISAISYSQSSIRKFCLSYVSSVLQRFTAINCLPDLWNRVIDSFTEENQMDVDTNDFPAPTFPEQLLKILYVCRIFQHISPKSIENLGENLKQMSNQLRKCCHLLTPDKLTVVYREIIEIFVEQAQHAIMLWKKGTAESLLMMIVETYLGANADNPIVDILHIIYKILLKTKVFQSCLWEIDVWLQSLRFVPQCDIVCVLEFFNNALFMIIKEEKDSTIPLTLNPSQDTNESVPHPYQKNYGISDNQFSSMMAAVLACLSEVSDEKKKACRTFVESAVRHIMHYQHNPEKIFALVEEHKDSLSSKSYSYCQLLYFLKVKCELKESGIETQKKKKIKSDFSKLLQHFFSSLHTGKDSESMDNLLKDVKCSAETLSNMEPFNKRSIAWQILLYMDIETKLLMEKKISGTSGLLEYQKIIRQLLDDDLAKSIEIAGQERTITHTRPLYELNIVKDVLQHPVFLKFFINFPDHIPKKVKTLFQECASSITQAVVNIATSLLHDSNFSYINEYFTPFKEKITTVCTSLENFATGDNQAFVMSQFFQVIESLSSALSIQDIGLMLENLLKNDDNVSQMDPQDSSCLILLKLYVGSTDFVLLSKEAVHTLFFKYANMSSKRKKDFREPILQLLISRPLYALFVDEKATLSLLDSRKDLYILDRLISCNNDHKQVLMLQIVNNSNELKESAEAYLFVISSCLSGNLSDENVIAFLKPIASTFWKTLTDVLLNDVTAHSQLLSYSNLAESSALLFENKMISASKLRKFFEKVLSATREEVPSLCKMNILLQLFKLWQQHVTNSSTFCLVFNISLHWLLAVIKSIQQDQTFEHHQILKFFSETLQDMPNFQSEELLDCNQQWAESYRHILKVALRNEDIGPNLLKIMQIYFDKMNSHVELPTQTTHDLITSHSQFFTLLLSDNSSLKESVIDLLTTIVDLDSNVCKQSHIPLLLSAYGATLSTVDQKLLCLIKKYEDNEIDITEFSPFLWGKAAVVHYAAKIQGNQSLLTQASEKDILQLFTRQNIIYTALNQPLNLELKPSIQNLDEESNEKRIEWNRVYDLRFVLPLFAKILSSDFYLECQTFIGSRVLFLIYNSLSSYNEDIRSLGYYCLTQFYYHLESSAKYRTKLIWIHLLDIVRNSIDSPNPRLSSIITLYLAKVVDFVLTPDAVLYPQLCKFLMDTPIFDLVNVPNFYTLFKSTDLEHRKQKMWILRLIKQGLHSSLDFHLCNKRSIFTILLHYYYSSLSTREEKIEILHIISAAVKVKTSARILFHGGFLSWLQNVIFETNPDDSDLVEEIVTIMSTAWHTSQKEEVSSDGKSKNFATPKESSHDSTHEVLQMASHESSSEAQQMTLDKSTNEAKKITIYSSFPYEFYLVHLRLLQKISNIDHKRTTEYLQTLLDVLRALRSDKATAFSTCYSKLSWQCVSQLHEKWDAMNRKASAASKSLTPPAEASEKVVDKLRNVNLLFARVMTHWEPSFQSADPVCRERQLTLFQNVVGLMLQSTLTTQDHSNDLQGISNETCKWLYRRLKEDKTMSLSVLLLSETNSKCFQLLCQHFESSLVLTVGQKTKKAGEISNRWRKLIILLEKAPQNVDCTDSLKVLRELCSKL